MTTVAAGASTCFVLECVDVRSRARLDSVLVRLLGQSPESPLFILRFCLFNAKFLQPLRDALVASPWKNLHHFSIEGCGLPSSVTSAVIQNLATLTRPLNSVVVSGNVLSLSGLSALLSSVPVAFNGRVEACNCLCDSAAEGNQSPPSFPSPSVSTRMPCESSRSAASISLGANALNGATLSSCLLRGALLSPMFVRFLDLQSNGLGTEGAKDLAGTLTSLPRLCALNVSCNGIGLEGLAALVLAASSHPRLGQACTASERIDAEVVAALQSDSVSTCGAAQCLCSPSVCNAATIPLLKPLAPWVFTTPLLVAAGNLTGPMLTTAAVVLARLACGTSCDDDADDADASEQSKDSDLGGLPGWAPRRSCEANIFSASTSSAVHRNGSASFGESLRHSSSSRFSSGRETQGATGAPRAEGYWSPVQSPLAPIRAPRSRESPLTILLDTSAPEHAIGGLNSLNRAPMPPCCDVVDFPPIVQPFGNHNLPVAGHSVGKGFSRSAKGFADLSPGNGISAGIGTKEVHVDDENSLMESLAAHLSAPRPRRAPCVSALFADIEDSNTAAATGPEPQTSVPEPHNNTSVRSLWEKFTKDRSSSPPIGNRRGSQHESPIVSPFTEASSPSAVRMARKRLRTSRDTGSPNSPVTAQPVLADVPRPQQNGARPRESANNGHLSVRAESPPRGNPIALLGDSSRSTSCSSTSSSGVEFAVPLRGGASCVANVPPTPLPNTEACQRVALPPSSSGCSDSESSCSSTSSSSGGARLLTSSSSSVSTAPLASSFGPKKMPPTVGGTLRTDRVPLSATVSRTSSVSTTFSSSATSLPVTEASTATVVRHSPMPSPKALGKKFPSGHSIDTSSSSTEMPSAASSFRTVPRVPSFAEATKSLPAPSAEERCTVDSTVSPEREAWVSHCASTMVEKGICHDPHLADRFAHLAFAVTSSDTLRIVSSTTKMKHFFVFGQPDALPMADDYAALGQCRLTLNPTLPKTRADPFAGSILDPHLATHTETRSTCSDSECATPVRRLSILASASGAALLPPESYKDFATCPPDVLPVPPVPPLAGRESTLSRTLNWGSQALSNSTAELGRVAAISSNLLSLPLNGRTLISCKMRILGEKFHGRLRVARCPRVKDSTTSVSKQSLHDRQCKRCYLPLVRCAGINFEITFKQHVLPPMRFRVERNSIPPTLTRHPQKSNWLLLVRPAALEIPSDDIRTSFSPAVILNLSSVKVADSFLAYWNEKILPLLPPVHLDKTDPSVGAIVSESKLDEAMLAAITAADEQLLLGNVMRPPLPRHQSSSSASDSDSSAAEERAGLVEGHERVSKDFLRKVVISAEVDDIARRRLQDSQPIDQESAVPPAISRSDVFVLLSVLSGQWLCVRSETEGSRSFLLPTSWCTIVS